MPTPMQTAATMPTVTTTAKITMTVEATATAVDGDGDTYYVSLKPYIYPAVAPHCLISIGTVSRAAQWNKATGVTQWEVPTETMV